MGISAPGTNGTFASNRQLAGMSLSGKLKRYLDIIERVRHRPTFAELLDHLREQGHALSERTLQRDIEDVRTDLGVELIYDRPLNRYHLDESELQRSHVMPLLERAVLGEILGGDGGAIREASAHVVMERNGALQGLQHWGSLLRAINGRFRVSIGYCRFRSDEPHTFRMRPFFLKEYAGRWYVLGIAEGYKDPISLGLDRIQQVEVSNKRFAVKDRERVMDHYLHVIGVDASPGKVERVVLLFTPLQGRYVQTLPLHHSQQVLKDDKKGLLVELLVQPNYEFRQELLGMAESVKVLEPASLAKAIAKAHKAAAKRYK
jgi:predicted DNA-binding transcriptional regulator YafY